MLSPKLLTSQEIDALTSAAAKVLAEGPFVAAYLYGSVARGQPANDIDIAVLFSGAVDWRLVETVAAKLQSAVPGMEMDVRPLNRAHPRFCANVLREGKLLVERDRKARLEFEARAIVEWLDFKPVWERQRQLMFERWLNG